MIKNQPAACALPLASLLATEVFTHTKGAFALPTARRRRECNVTHDMPHHARIRKPTVWPVLYCTRGEDRAFARLCQLAAHIFRYERRMDEPPAACSSARDSTDRRVWNLEYCTSMCGETRANYQLSYESAVKDKPSQVDGHQVTSFHMKNIWQDMRRAKRRILIHRKALLL